MKKVEGFGEIVSNATRVIGKLRRKLLKRKSGCGWCDDVVRFKRDMDVSYQCGKGSLGRNEGGWRGGRGRDEKGWSEDERREER